MSRLTAIPGLPPEAIELLQSCGIESPEMLAGIPAAEVHRVLELTAWQKGKLNHAPTLDMVHHWTELARLTPVAAGGVTGGEDEDIPEAIVMTRTELPARKGYVPPAQRARLEAAGPPVPAAAPAPLPENIIPSAVIPASLPGPRPSAVPMQPSPVRDAASAVRFNTFEDYQSGNLRVPPLSRFSIDDPAEMPAPGAMERLPNTDDLPRTMRRGVVHPNPALLIFGALISLLWRGAMIAAVIAVPWLFLNVPRPSDYRFEIMVAAGVLLALGVAQLLVLGRCRCRICTCHLFYSRDTVKNRKAHSIPLFGKTASLSLHLLLFQWFRCMYCGTAIKLWASKNDRAS